MSEYTQLKEQMNEIDDLNARIAELEAERDKLRFAINTVLNMEGAESMSDGIFVVAALGVLRGTLLNGGRERV